MGKGRSSTRNRNFSTSGPKHLTQLDWANENHCRSVMACLVQGVYYHRLDYKKGREGDKAIGPPWWESYYFKLFDDLKDRSRAFGVIFELDYQSAVSRGVKSLEKAPRFVVAFRGTQSFTDIVKDYLLCVERLEKDDRIQIAIDKVKEIVSLAQGDPSNGNRDVYLAGHSLGASVATCIGMKMAMSGIFLETFLFNPPFLRLTPETLKHKSFRIVIQIIQELIFKVMKQHMVKCQGGRMEGNICKWFPRLYLNPNDYVCKGFIPYFKNQGLFVGVKPGLITRKKKRGKFYDLYARWGAMDSHSLYLIPSAKLIINKKKCSPGASTWVGGKVKKLSEAHSLEQWLSPDLELEYEEHKYNDTGESGDGEVRQPSGLMNSLEEFEGGESSTEVLTQYTDTEFYSDLDAEIYSDLDTEFYSDLDPEIYSDLDTEFYSDLDTEFYSDLDSDSDSDSDF